MAVNQTSKIDVGLYYSGFNGFGQCKELNCSSSNYFNLLSLKNVEDAMFTWNNLIVRCTESVIVSGFVDGDHNKMITLGNIKNIVQMSCSSFRQHALFVSSTGDCWQWTGGTSVKKLMNFISTENCGSEKQTENIVMKVCCSEQNSLALSSVGQLYSLPSLLPTAGIKVTDIACGFEHNLLLTDSGAVYAWGSGSRGQLGLGELEDEETPVELVSLSGVVCIAASGWHSAAVTDRGELWTWGWNNEGQLGFPTIKSANDNDEVVNISAVPLLVGFGSECRNVKEVACGNRHTVVLLDDNTVWGCGWNAYGQLGKSPNSWPNFINMTRLKVPEGRVRRILAGCWSTGLLIDNVNT